jgi:excinuclease ABC subunit A
LYILDEPTTGLHFEDIRVLLSVLRKLVENGNTVIVIEHNLDVIRACDYLIDMGPNGGSKGGEVVATGTLQQIKQNKRSLTGKYL